MKITNIKKLDHRVIWVDSMIGMTYGFISSLIVGTIIGLFGIEQHNTFSDMVNNIKHMLTYITGFAIGIGIGIKLKMKPLQIIALAIGTWITSQSLVKPTFNHSVNNIYWGVNNIGINTKLILPGDVFSAWLSGVMWIYFFKIVQWDFHIDIILLPIIGVIIGFANSFYLTYITSSVTEVTKLIIYNSANKVHWAGILLAPVIGIIMGLALSLPTSSAAIAFALQLKGDAATAAMAGTAAQMISFGVMTYISTKSIQKSLAVGFGTSMLQIHNFSRKPKLLILPAITSALAALVAVPALPLSFPLEDGITGRTTSGMGAAALYGQIFTLHDNGWDSLQAWLNVILIQLALPAITTYFAMHFLIKKNFYKKEWLKI